MTALRCSISAPPRPSPLHPPFATPLPLSSPFLQALEDYWFPPPLTVRWLLVSNSQRIKKQLLRIFPQKVVTTGEVILHTVGVTQSLKSDNATEAQQAAHAYRLTVAEWLLLASCHEFVIPMSGFSRTAALYSMRTSRIFTPPCNPEANVRLSSFLTWSGF
eukprot:TRINITY_DN29487_c0_g1_i1.p2 TRINITY_DN29487_c0_g1~~TRINITY_DN29487_c0_g1_i1.p2  ORF type:complete len:161 (-),score=3.18 TRINITY_DN29487_c0_g1_i1:360-842(-)